MTIHEAARFLKLRFRSLYLLAQRGQVPACKIGRTWRFSRSRLTTWIDRRMQANVA